MTAGGPTGREGELVLVGEIVAPHGVRGEVRMNPLMDAPETLLRLPSVHFVYPGGRTESRRIRQARLHKQQVLLVLDGVEDREAAEALRGVEIYIRRAELPERDVYYIDELIGLSVITEAGQDLGRIEAVHPYPANDVYETPLALIPGIPDEFVISIDPAAGRVVVRDVPGLRKDE